MHSIDYGDCKFDIVYCIVSCCFVLCVLYFLSSFVSDCCTTEFVDLRNDMYVYVCMCVCVCMYMYVCVCVYVCICMYMYVCVCMYVYMYVYPLMSNLMICTAHQILFD